MTDEEQPVGADRQSEPLRLYRYALAGFGMLLFATTWRLWTPETVFPQIPFFASLTAIPAWLDWLVFPVTIITLLVACTVQRERVWRRSMMVFAIAATVLILLDQHRFQPWAYQLVVFAVILANCRQSTATQLMRWIVASIYVYSAISKIDYQFLHSLGPDFLTTLTGFVGITTENWSNQTQVFVSSLFPLGELCIGMGLLFQRTRRVAVFAAVVSHVLLLLILGPLGLDHRPAVLIWNIFFIVQAWMLFAKTANDGESETMSPRFTIYEWSCYAITGVAVAFPITELLGYCDHWPAWELYSPRNSRSFVAIHESAIDRLPEQIQQELAPPQEDNPWRQLHLDRWSLNSLDVPIYPEDRFQTAIALAIADRYDLQLAIHVTQQSASDRWTGERETHTFRGSDQVKEACHDFLVGTRARH